MERELKINLPYKNMAHFQKIFAELEENQSQLKVRDFGLCLNSLQDVFLQVTLDQDKEELPKIERDLNIDLMQMANKPLHQLQSPSNTQVLK